MLKFKLLIIAMAATTGCFSQGWTQKSNFSGGQRAYAFSFVIGSKAFMGTGLNTTQVTNDLWEYDPANDSWTQRAAFIGQARYNAVSFVIGSKGYVGTGANVFQIGSANFYEYDPATNIWRVRASLANGLQRTGAVGFAIGSKGYIGLGRNNTYFKNDLWEYNPAANNWTQRANYPGLACSDATAFTIGSKAYVGLGYNSTTAFRNFFEYNPVSNSWKSKAQLPSLIRSSACAMVIGNKGYVALGSSYTKDVWEYDPATNQWKRKMNFIGSERKSAASFAVNGKGYIVGGMLRSVYFDDVWQYEVDTCRISSLAKPHVTPSLCLYDSIMMSANADSGMAYQWRLDAVDIPGANSRFYYAKTPGYYSVVLTGNYICSNISSGINVIKPCNETPAIAEAGADKRICIDDSAFIKGAVSGTATRATWSGGSGIFLPNNDSLFVTYVPTAAEYAAGKVKLYLAANDPDGSGPIIAGVDSLNVYISTGPPPPTTINGPWNFCSGTANYIYSVPAEKGVVYSWVVSDDAAINSGQGTGSINVSYNGTAVSDTVFVTSTNACGTSPEIFITVNRVTGIPAATPPITGLNSGCPVTSSRYSVTRTVDAIGYTWSPPKGATINGSSDPVTTLDTAVTVVYTKYFNGDTLKVKAVNCFGSRTEEMMLIPRKFVDPPAGILGSKVGCMNDSNIYKFNKVPYAEYYLWTLPIGATIKGKALTYSSPDTAVTIVFTGAFSSDSIKVKAYGCAGFSINTSLMINRATGATSCHGCTLSSTIDSTTTHCAGDSVKLSAKYTGASEICNSCERNASGIYSSTGNVTNPSASLAPDGVAAWLTRGNSAVGTRIIWDMGEVIPAGSMVSVGVKTDGCSGTAVKSNMQFSMVPSGGANPEMLISQSGTISYYSSKYREFSFNTSIDGQFVALSDEGGCGIRVDYIKWKKSCCTASSSVNYLWSTGATTSDISVTPSTTTGYWVKVTDRGGCFSTGNVSVNIVEKPLAAISGNGSICPGSTTELCAETADSYLWSNGTTSQCITVNSAGNFTLTVTNGVCAVTDTMEVSEIVVSDNNECTIDACDPLTGQVSHTAINIDDNNACTTDACDPSTGPSHSTINVDDNNACTADGCDASTGVYHNPIATDDQNACTIDGCNANTGVYHTPVLIDDSNLCTIDACNSGTGAVTHTTFDLNDNNACTTDACNPDIGTTHVAINVNDNNACTTDACDPMTGPSHVSLNVDDNNICTTDGCNTISGVYHNPVNTDDRDACTIDGCNTSTGVYHTPLNINDNNLCTVDACNSTTGAITHTVVNIDDNNACTMDACNAFTGVTHVAINTDDNNACTADACDPATGPSHTNINVDDNNVCTTDGCNSVTGVFHTAVNTNDNDACTTDGCNAVTGVNHTAVNINDNNACTIDACNTNTGAITHTAINLNDNNACTTDACNPTTGPSHIAINLNDNNACTYDACDPVSGPSHTAIAVDDNNKCTIDGCNSTSGVFHTPVNSNDNNACTTDGCDLNAGIYNTPIDLDDNNECTFDACNSVTGVITHAAIDINDNNACTTDACDPATGQSHTPVNVNDNNACTIDGCDPIKGVSHAAVNVNDNNVCTTDGCNATTGVYHNAVNINDGNSCTIDACNPITGAITHTPFANPADPVITGTTVVCSGSQWGYKAKGTTGVTNYTWTIPNGITIISGQGTDSIILKYGPQFNSGNICATAITSCGSSRQVCLPITSIKTVPSISGSITGKSLGVCIGTTEQYCIAAQANTSSYLWTIPTNSQIISGSGTNCITVKFLTGFKSGTVTVKAQNCNGSSAALSLTITSLPATPGAISGEISSLSLKKGVSYAITAVVGATGYTWTVPTGALLVSGQGTTAIIVDFTSGFSSGQISVIAVNSCGNSAARTVSVNASSSSSTVISGPAAVCAYDAGITYEVASQSGYTYSWTVPTGASIASGQGTASIKVNWGTVSGTVKVNPSSGFSKSINVTVTNCLKNSSELLSPLVPGFMINPNPAKTDFSLVYRVEKDSEYDLVIRDMVGKIVYHDKLESSEGMNIESLKTDGFSKGLYIITLSSEKENKSLRLAIE